MFFELRSRIRHYYEFSKKEVRDIVIAVVAVGFIFSFRDWGIGTDVNLLFGIRNWVLAILASLISFFVHLSAQRIYALSVGFKAEFKLWWGGLIASLILAFVSNGFVQLVLAGTVVNSLLMRLRLGEFRYGFNILDNAYVAVSGPISNILLALVTKVLLYIFPNSWFLEKLLYINVIFAICSMLPLPSLDGINVFFGNRAMFFFMFFTILVMGLLIYFSSITLSIFGGLFIGSVAMMLNYHKPFI